MEIARHWRLRQQRYALVGEICGNGHPVFPPRDICPTCAAAAKTPHKFSGKGEVYSYTTVYDAPEGFEGQTPYTVALVRLIEETAGKQLEGPLVTAMLTDLDTSLPPDKKVHIGMPVEMVTRKLHEDGDKGIIVYGYKFRQTLEPAPADFSVEALIASLP